MGFQKLADILNLARKNFPALGKRIEEAEALARWEQAVGPQIARHARAIRVQDEVLWVEVDHPIWKSELHHRRRQILEILNTGRLRGAPAPGAPASQAPDRIPLKDILFLDPRGPAGTHREKRST